MSFEPTDHEKELMQALFPWTKWEPDDALESWRVYVMREIVELQEIAANEAGLPVSALKEDEMMRNTHAWLWLINEERDRRMNLAEKGAPAYTGTDRLDHRQVDEVKRYFTGETWASLFVELTGFSVFPTGHNYRYRCQFHGEDREPSGYLYVDEGRYHCFACHAGGDVFDLVIRMRGEGFAEALHWLRWRMNPYEETSKGRWRRSSYRDTRSERGAETGSERSRAKAGRTLHRPEGGVGER